MTTGRITFTPDADRRAQLRRQRAIALACWLVVAAAACAASATIYLKHADAVEVTPLPAPVMQTFPLEPLDAESVTQARIEAFRAGYRMAIEQGCQQPVALSFPLQRP